MRDYTKGLSAWWDKRERDLMIGHPRSCDGHWLSGIFNKAFTDELIRRGYDISTLKFSINLVKKDEET